MEQLVFVGEKRSAKAVALGVTWHDGRLAARTLFNALRALGDAEPQRHHFVNLFLDCPSYQLRDHSLDLVRELRAQGHTVVGLGRRVQRVLDQAGIEHLPLYHPAARGAIRKTERYQAHVADVLGAALGGAGLWGT